MYCRELSYNHRPWSALLMDLLNNIVSRLKTTLDVTHFALVCPAWKAASYTSSLHPCKQFPWLFVPEILPLCDSNYYNFDYIDPRNTGCRYSCPLADVLGRCCMGSGLGWVVMLGNDERITMVNPLGRVCLPLPPQSTLRFPSEWRDKDKFRSYISKIVIGKDNSGSIVAVAISSYRRSLAIGRPKDRKWTTNSCNFWRISDAIFHEGQIYAVDYKGRLVAWNATGQAEWIADPPNHKLSRRQRRKWYIMVSSSGCLLLVVREYDEAEEPNTIRFKVFELLLEESRWLQIEDMGDQALFVGFNTSTSLKAPGTSECKANCVYFTNDCVDVYRRNGKYLGCGYDNGKYNLKGSWVEGNYCLGCLYSPPLWYIPRLP